MTDYKEETIILASPINLDALNEPLPIYTQGEVDDLLHQQREEFHRELSFAAKYMNSVESLCDYLNGLKDKYSTGTSIEKD